MSELTTVEAMRTETLWFDNRIDARRVTDTMEHEGWAVRSVTQVLDHAVVIFEIER